MSSVIRGNDGFDSAGGNAVKAWVNFNGTGTVAIRAGFNVSSITDNGVGDYTVNFTTPMIDADYAVATVGTQPIFANQDTGTVSTKRNDASQGRTTTSLRLDAQANSTTNGTATDLVLVCVTIFR